MCNSVLSLFFHVYYCACRHAFALADYAEMFGRRRRDVYIFGGQAECGGYVFSHKRDISREFGALCHNDSRDVCRGIAVFGGFFAHLFKELDAVCSLVCGIVVGEEHAYIGESGGGQHSVCYGVNKYVCVAVSVKSFLVRDLHASEYEFSVFLKLMDVESYARFVRAVVREKVACRRYLDVVGTAAYKTRSISRRFVACGIVGQRSFKGTVGGEDLVITKCLRRLDG